MPRVSIIINVYNGQATLRETIDSVFGQTFSDWEIIIWDDCSTDGSLSIIADYDDSRIRVYRSDRNRGLALSRMAALRQTTGEWVAFIDQDDLWSPEKLAIQLAMADSDHELGFIYARTVRFFPGGQQVDYDHRHEFEELPEGDIFQELFVDSCFIAMSSVLFRRKVFDVVPQLPDAVSACPDYYYYLAITRRFRVAAVQRAVCHYRVHAGNMTRSHGEQMQREILALVGSWSGNVPAVLIRKRLRVHSTVLAVHQMRSIRGFGPGILTLLRQGDVIYLLSRPFAKAYRGLRRRIVTPFWKRTQATSHGERALAR